MGGQVAVAESKNVKPLNTFVIYRFSYDNYKTCFALTEMRLDIGIFR